MVGGVEPLRGTLKLEHEYSVLHQVRIPLRTGSCQYLGGIQSRIKGPSGNSDIDAGGRSTRNEDLALALISQCTV